MAGKAIATVTEIVLGDMLATLTRDQLFAMPAKDANKAGIVLANERVKVFMSPGVGEAPIEFTASIYIQRGAMTDDEAVEVARVASERKASADAKKAEEQNRLAADKRAAFELGQSSTLGALKHVNELAAAAGNLAKLSR